MLTIISEPWKIGFIIMMVIGMGAGPAGAATTTSSQARDSGLERSVTPGRFRITDQEITQYIKRNPGLRHLAAKSPKEVERLARQYLEQEVSLQASLEESNDPLYFKLKNLTFRFLLGTQYLQELARTVKVTDKEIPARLPWTTTTIRIRLIIVESPEAGEEAGRLFAGTGDIDAVMDRHGLNSNSPGCGWLPGYQSANQSYFSRQDEEYLWALEPGTLSKVISSKIGYVVCYIEDKKELTPKEAADLKEKTRREIQREKLSVLLTRRIENVGFEVNESNLMKVFTELIAGNYLNIPVVKVAGEDFSFFEIDNLIPNNSFSNAFGRKPIATLKTFFSVYLSNLEKQLRLSYYAEAQGLTLTPENNDYLDSHMRSKALAVLRHKGGTLPEKLRSVKSVEAEIYDFPESRGGCATVLWTLVGVESIAETLRSQEEAQFVGTTELKTGPAANEMIDSLVKSGYYIFSEETGDCRVMVVRKVVFKETAETATP